MSKYYTTRPMEVIRAIDELSARNKGILTPELVIKEAKPQGSPLHDQFTWDNYRAGHLWRVQQARNLLRTYSMRRIRGMVDPVGARKFYLVRVEDDGPKKYVAAGDVFKSEDLTRKAAVEAYGHFQKSLKMLEPFPKYFSELLDAIHAACSRVHLEERGSAAAQ